MSDWQQAQEWEHGWWDDCANTHSEEEKQLVYARKMGLTTFHDGKSPYNFDLGGASILDIGGGPVSLLLKCVNFQGKVVDPLRFPDWVLARYELAGIEFERAQGECIEEAGWDECWLYNVLEHTEDPALIVQNARKAAGVVRIFQWIDTGISAGHLHSLTAAQLDGWLGGEGKVEQINRRECKGKGYYGIFPTENYRQ